MVHEPVPPPERRPAPLSLARRRAAAGPGFRRSLRRLLSTEDPRFAELLAAQAATAVSACALLRERGTAAAMADLEARGDALRRDLATAIVRTYATPLDRDDLFALSGRLDDVVDAAQEALLTARVFAGPWTGHAEEMAFALFEGAEVLAKAVAALPRPPARAPARRVRKLANVVGSLYRYGVELAIRLQPPAEAMRLREIYLAFLDVARALSAAADLVSDIAVKEK